MSSPGRETFERTARIDAASSDPAEELLAECLALPGTERKAALEEVCSKHPDLAVELRTRIAALRAMGIELGESRGFPEQLGDFRLIERLGGGGMGVVFLAVQTSLQRDVALKLIRPEHLYFAGARARFRREAEAVARLDHPGIVPIYAVGEDQSVPYFAMELVRGCTLAEALRALHERAPESLRGADLHAVVAEAAESDDTLPEDSLFDGTWIQVCVRIARAVADALQHAHERGLVHRDVKPSNVALSPDGRVRLFDFGLTSAAGAPEMTRTGSALGTLHYMSPEQLRKAGSADARSDVYSLGIALYEMLALQLPYRGDDALEVQRLVIDGRADPIRPRNRRVGPELETVVLRAIDRDPARRYASAADFARDLGHLLAHRPIEARRPGTLLVARRWMQRHLIAATALVVAPVLALGAGAVMLVLERAHSRELTATLDEVRVARDEAERDAKTAKGALDFVLRMFNPKALEPGVSAKGTREDIDDLFLHGEASVAEQLADDPRAQARMYTLIGRLHARRNSNQRAIELYEKALAIWRAEEPRAVAPYLAETLANLGEAYHLVGRGLEAMACLRESLPLWPAGPEGERGRDGVFHKMLRYGPAFETHDGIEATARRALEEELARPEVDARAIALCRNSLASTLLRRHAFSEAGRELELAYAEFAGGRIGPDLSAYLSVVNNLALVRHNLGRTGEAIALLADALSVQRKLVPRDERNLGAMLLNMAAFEEFAKDYRAALEHARESVALLTSALTSEHPTTLGSLARLARYAAHLGECDEADEAACKVLAARAKLDPGDPTAGRALTALAICAEKRADVESAEQLWRSAADTLSACPGYRLEAASPLHHLGRLRLAAGAVAEADALLADAYDRFSQRVQGVPRFVLEDLARVARVAGRENEALAYESRLEE